MTESRDHGLSGSASRFDESRRAFLAQTATLAGAAGLTAALGACATDSGGYGTSATPAPKARARAPIQSDAIIRMGVIGTGGMGTGHCEAFMAINKNKREQVQIVALADVCEPRLDAARKKCEEGQSGVSVDTTTDYHKLLDRGDLQGVLIASPEHWHAQMAIDAIAAGKDVYVEKPMTLRLDDAIRLYKAAGSNPSTIVQVGTQYVQYPRYQEAKKVISTDGVGKITFSQTSYCRNSKEGEWLYYAIDPQWKPGVNLDWDAWCGPLGKQPWDPEVYARWRRYRKYSTGIIGDLLVHQMTPLMMAMDQGWPTRVVASGGHLVDKKMENHDQININVEFEKEHIMIVAGSTCNENGLEILIRGHKGNIRLGGNNCDVSPEPKFSDEFDAKSIQCPDIGDPQDAHRVAWLKSIRTREPSLASVELGTKVMVIVDLATRSLWDGRAYEFDAKSMKASRV